MNSQALTIGGTTGIGKATAALLLKKGIEVIVAGRADKNQSSVPELSEMGTVKKVALDLSNAKEVEVFAADLLKIAPNLRYLVNAAGYFRLRRLLPIQWQKLVCTA